jgi:hypothetical protein
MPIKLEAIVPKRLFKLRTVRAEMLMEMERQIDIIDRMYGATYRSWTHKPQFTKAFRTATNFLEAKVSTIDVIYAWTDDGTRPHPILPRNVRGVLAFPAGFTPKTKVRTIGSGRGSKSGSVFTTHVFHPGTKARNFTKEIVKRRSKPYVKQMRAAIRRGVLRGA